MSQAEINNNPGNLKFIGQDGAQRGTQASDGGYFAKFNSPDEGYVALMNDVHSKMTGATTTGLTKDSTLSDFVGKYAPPKSNDTDQYIVDLANKLKVSPNSKLSDLQPRVPELAGAIAEREDANFAKKYPLQVPSQSSNGQQSSSQPQGNSSESDGFIRTANILPPTGGVQDSPDLKASTGDSTAGKISGFLGDVTGTTKLGEGLGYSINNAMGGQDAITKANDMSGEIQGKLIQRIKENKTAGKDTSRLESALAELTKNIQDTGNQVENVGTGGITNNQVLGSAAQTALTIGTLPSLIKGGVGLIKEAKNAPVVENALSKFIPTEPMAGESLNSFLSRVSGPTKNLSSIERFDALTKALPSATPVEKVVLQQAIDKIAPQAIKDAGGIVAFSQLYPKLAKVGGLMKSLIKGIGGVAVGAGLGSEATNLYHKIVR